jgi:hypothetical protein
LPGPEPQDIVAGRVDHRVEVIGRDEDRYRLLGKHAVPDGLQEPRDREPVDDGEDRRLRSRGDQDDSPSDRLEALSNGPPGPRQRRLRAIRRQPRFHLAVCRSSKSPAGGSLRSSTTNRGTSRPARMMSAVSMLRWKFVMTHKSIGVDASRSRARPACSLPRSVRPPRIAGSPFSTPRSLNTLSPWRIAIRVSTPRHPRTSHSLSSPTPSIRSCPKMLPPRREWQDPRSGAGSEKTCYLDR